MNDLNNMLQAKDLNTFLKILKSTFNKIDTLDVLKAVQILAKNNKDFIVKNLTNKNLNKLVYNYIQNYIPHQIVDLIGTKYHFSDAENDILDQLFLHDFHFDTLIYNQHVLKAIDTIILEEQKKNISLIKDDYNFDEIFDNEKDEILQKLSDNANRVMYEHIDELHSIIKETDIKDIDNLNKFLIQHPQYLKIYVKEIVGTILAKNICKKYNYNINVAILFSTYIPTRVDIIKLILQVINSMDLNILFSEFIGEPWEFINFNDSTEAPNNIVYSTISPYDFSGNRSGPLIILESEVLRGN